MSKLQPRLPAGLQPLANLCAADRGIRNTPAGGVQVFQVVLRVLQLVLQLLHGALVTLAHRLLMVAQDGHLWEASGIVRGTLRSG